MEYDLFDLVLNETQRGQPNKGFSVLLKIFIK